MKKILNSPYNLVFLAIIVLLLIAPLFLSDFRVNLLGKFIAFAILAVGIDLIWGYTGILSLGHGVFFGLGACLRYGNVSKNGSLRRTHS